MLKYILISFCIICLNPFSIDAKKCVLNYHYNLKYPNAYKIDVYKVYRIDSLKDFYIIYVTKNKVQFKVVTKKVKSTCHNSIEIGKKYPLKLSPVLGQIATGVFKPTCVIVAKGTEVCLEKSITDICYVDNLNGLCLVIK